MKTTNKKINKSGPETKTPTSGDVDRVALKGIVKQLKDAGTDVKVLKSDTNEVLRRKVNDAIQHLPSPEMAKKLEAIDPNKLTSVLNRDCFGLFIDLADVSCVRCVDAASCVSAFFKNLRTPPDFERVMTDVVLPKVAAPVSKVPATRYDPGRLVFVRDVPNPNPKGDDYHDTFKRVLESQPEDLAELRKLVEVDFDVESDKDFMNFVNAMRDEKEGIIKLDVDLSASDKVALREAGYEV